MTFGATLTPTDIMACKVPDSVTEHLVVWPSFTSYLPSSMLVVGSASLFGVTSLVFKSP